MAKEKIVVIDDSPIVRKLAELALEEEGYKVYTAEDGEEGLRISEEVLPSVILVDFIMPRMSGYQFCKSARENELLKDIPIILITGKGEDVGKKFAEKFGVVDYFIKPFKSEMLIDKVNSIVNAQRQRAGEETLAFEKLEEPAAEVPVYSFEEPELAAGPAYEMPKMPELLEMPELPEIPEVSVEPAHAFDAFAVAASADIVGEEASGIPVLSFDEVATMEEPQPAFQGGMEEIDLGASSFDFNLEGLAALQSETELEETPAMLMAPESATEITEAFDFEAIKELKEMVTVEDATGYGALSFADSPAHTTEMAATEGTMDRIMQRYFSSELPLLIGKSIEDVLKCHNIIKPTTILLSGSLQEICSVEILKLIASNRLTGKLFAFSAVGSAEVYFDLGLVAYALSSRHGRPPVSKQEITDELGEGLGERMSEVLAMVADMRDGGFFFEKIAIPAALVDIPQRMDVVALLLQGERRGQSGENYVTITDNLVFGKLAGDVLNCDLNEEEHRIFTLTDGVRSVGDIISVSGIKPAETRMILYRLSKIGILGNKGGI